MANPFIPSRNNQSFEESQVKEDAQKANHSIEDMLAELGIDKLPDAIILDERVEKYLIGYSKSVNALLDLESRTLNQDDMVLSEEQVIKSKKGKKKERDPEKEKRKNKPSN